ncbi:tyrosine-type recombinase/integrase [Chloroflexota bacterium]
MKTDSVLDHNTNRIAVRQRKSNPDIQELISRYELAKRAEGKSPRTIKGYRELLLSFCRYIQERTGSTSVSSFAIDIVRGYIIYLQTRPKFQGHPFTSARGEGLSVESVRDHVRTLKTFSTWLHIEGYTREKRLANLKLPKPEEIIIEPLAEDEVITVLDSIDQKTRVGQRNHVIVFLMLDTGLRVGEVTGAELMNFKPADGYLKVKGKGKKERIVPVGAEAQTLVSSYITYVRSKMTKSDCTRLFVSEDGGPISENAIKLFFSRQKKKSGITRLHAHLCRHTFAINYLLLDLKEVFQSGR